MNNKITETTKNIIDQESSVLGSDVNYQLKQARLKALGSNSKNNNFLLKAWFIPTTAVAAMALYFMLPLLQVNTVEEHFVPEIFVNIDDIELLEQLDQLEQLELVENLEFYEWLSADQDLSSI